MHQSIILTGLFQSLTLRCDQSNIDVCQSTLENVKFKCSQANLANETQSTFAEATCWRRQHSAGLKIHYV